jgi:hypothetical protein
VAVSHRWAACRAPRSGDFPPFCVLSDERPRAAALVLRVSRDGGSSQGHAVAATSRTSQREIITLIWGLDPIPKRSAMTCAFASVSNTVSERALLLSLPVSHVPD